MQIPDKYRDFVEDPIGYIWRFAFPILITIGFIVYAFKNPWKALLGVLVLFLIWRGLVYIFGKIGEGLDERDKKIEDKFEGWEQIGDGFQRVYKCKPSMEMIKQATSEKTLGFQIPPYFIIDSYGTPPNFTGDYFESIELHFDIPLTDEILRYLDNQSNNPNTKWSKGTDGYVLKVDEIDLDKKNDHYFTIEIENDGMVITEGRV